MKQLAQYESQAYALLRIVAGFMFSFHGAQKVLGALTEFQPAIGSQLWIGGVIELAGGLIMLGLGNPLGRLHLQRRDGSGLFPVPLEVPDGNLVLSHCEQRQLAVLYCFMFLLIACKGAGIWSLDRAD